MISFAVAGWRVVEQARPHLIGRAFEHGAEHRGRELAPPRDRVGEIAVVARPIHQAAQRGFGEARPAVRRHLARHRHVAALDQHAGHLLAEFGASGDRGEMRLALGAGDRDEFLLAEPIGPLQHRAGDLDRVVVREAADQPVGRVLHAGHALGELEQRLPFDLPGELLEHVIEHAGLRRADARGGDDEQVGDAAKHFGALLGRAALNGRFEFAEQ